MKPVKLFFIAILIMALAGKESLAQKEDSGAALTMEGSPFGIAWGFLYGYNGAKAEVFMPQLRQMGIHLTKLYLIWQQIEPEKGKYQWGAVDTFLTQMQPGDQALFAIFSSSLWATKKASVTLPPTPAKSMDDYYDFIFSLVKHCEGKIKYWQNDCEPNNPVYWGGTVDEFISELKVFYKAVKDADPSAKVVIGGYDGLFNPPGMFEYPTQKAGLAFFEKAIKEASDYFDIFDLRLYADPYTIPGRVDYFKEKLAATGKDIPIICTEYNGPAFFEFQQNMKYVAIVQNWSASVASGDTTLYNSLKNPLAAMYDTIQSLAPQTQMFMMGCSRALNDKYYRMQTRDIVMRNILALSAGVQKTWYWDLYHETNDTLDLMTLMYGKNKLMDFNNGKLSKQYPQVEAFKKLVKYFPDIKSVRRIIIPGKENLYYFEESEKNGTKTFVAWERRDSFSGEDSPATAYTLTWQFKGAKATDLFGKDIPAEVKDGKLQISLSLTPVFIKVNN